MNTVAVNTKTTAALRAPLLRQRRSVVAVKAAVGLPAEYGYVIASTGVTAAVLQWQAINVAIARRKFNVQYPKMYADGDSGDARTFNCVQRAHQNTLETAPAMTIMTALLGLVYPVPAALLATVWAAGRVAYALGYSTGDPNKRLPGVAVSGLAYLGAIIAVVVVGLRMAL